MKECVVVAPHKYEIRDVPMPELADDYEVLVQMKAAGVCGSDFHIYHGTNPCSTYPRIPGHENVGVIAKVGKKVTRVKEGDHVAVDLVITCGECYQCKIGRENVCENVLVRGSGTDGGWREYFTAPETDVYVIPPEIPWKDAALIEPFAIGGHCTGRGRLAPDDIVYILGAGTIGSIILQTCKAAGATVVVADVNDESLERAKGYGADYTINPKKENLIQRIGDITKGKGISLAFDAACFKGSLTSLFEPGIMRNAGRVVSLGFCTEPESITQAMIDQRELDLIGSRMSAYQFEPTIAKMAAGKFNLNGIATTFIKFSDIDQVFHNMNHPSPDVKKMVILFDE
ncbi:MAG: alcohol dehydrogenase catalytic domain-containing protein [Planctomycetaceae bacterium]|nr:alcohol dehydrogenase catalytic domain-containing protein [Planctomycetaceae bacterium]